MAVANFLPVPGVLWLGWDVLSLLLLYWAESIIIGVVNILRMVSCDSQAVINRMLSVPPLNRTASLRYHNLPGVPSTGIKFFLIPFFIVHYGMFCFGHIAVIAAIFSPDEPGTKLSVALPALWPQGLWLPIAALLLSHLYSYRNNFIGQGEYRRTDLMTLMHRPYSRIVIMQLTVILGAGLITWLHSALPMLLVLIAGKTVLDLKLHERERRKFAVINQAGLAVSQQF